MRLGAITKVRVQFGLAISVLVFLAFVHLPQARAQSDDPPPNVIGMPGVVPDPPSDQDAATDQSAMSPTDQAHDAASAADDALESAKDARDELEEKDAPQDQIDAANQAVAQARAAKEAADEAAEKADESAGEAQDQ